MRTKGLGNSDMEITSIGFGAWAIGGKWTYGWGAQDDKQSIATINKALDSGINWIDTAAVYGLGHSEEVIGKALKERSEKPFVFTKCTLIWNEKGTVSNSMKADSIRRELENSLSRLGVDVIDLYQIHWPIPEAEIEKGWETLAQLKAEGKVRFIGVSNFSIPQMDRLRKISPITSLQPPYSLIRRDVEGQILPYCCENRIGVIGYSPMASGLLSGKMSRERIERMDPTDWRARVNANFKDPLLERNLKLQELLKSIGAQYGCTAGAVAIAWTLLHPAVTATIVGMRNPDQIDGVIQAEELILSDDDQKRIEDFLQQNP